MALLKFNPIAHFLVVLTLSLLAGVFYDLGLYGIQISFTVCAVLMAFVIAILFGTDFYKKTHVNN